MIAFDFLVCAEKLMKETEKDSYSAINILEDFPVEAFPAFIPKLSVLLVSTKLTGDVTSIQVLFQVLNNADVIFSKELPVNFLDKLKANTALNVSNLVVKNPGTLVFKFSHQEEEIDYTINVRLRDRPAVSVDAS